MLKRLKTFIITAAALALLAFGANLAVDNAYTHHLLRQFADGEIKRATNVDLDFKAMKLTVVPPGFDLFGVSVTPRGHPGEPLVSFTHLKARLSLWALVIGQLRIGRLEIDDLAATWPPPIGFTGFVKNDQTAPGTAPSQWTWPPDFELPFDRLELKNAKIFAEVPLFEIPAAAKVLSLAAVGVDLAVAWHGWQDLAATLKARSFDLAVGSASLLEETAVTADLAVIGQHLTAATLSLKGPRFAYEGSGSVDLHTSDATKAPQRLEVDTTGEIHGDLSVLGSFLDIDGTFGVVNGDARTRLSIPLDDQSPLKFEVRGQGQVRDGHFAGFRLFDSATSFVVDNQAVALPAIDLIVAGKTVAKGSGRVRLDDALSVEFSARPMDLHLVDLLDALTVNFDLADVTLHSGQVGITGTGDPLKLAVTAAAVLQDIEIPALPNPEDQEPPRKSPSCHVDFRLGVEATHLDFKGTHGSCRRADLATTSQVEVSGRVQLDGGSSVAGQHLSPSGGRPEPVDLFLRSDNVDIALGETFALIPLEGHGRASSHIHGDLNHLKVDNVVSGSGVKVLGMPFGQVRGQASVDVSRLEVTWNQFISEPPGGGQIVSPSGQLMAGQPELPLRTSLIASHISQQDVQAMVHGVTALDGQGLDLGASINRVEVTLNAPAAEPFRGTGAAIMDLGAGVLAGAPLFDQLSGRIDLTRTGLSSHNLTARLGGLNVATTFDHRRDPAGNGLGPGWLVRAGLSLSDQLSLTFQANGTTQAEASTGASTEASKVDHLAHLPIFGPDLQAADIQGSIEGNGKISGRIDKLQGTFTGSLRNIRVLGAQMSPTSVRGFIKDSVLDAVVDQGGNAIAGRLTIDLARANFPYEWFFTFNKADLRALGTSYFHSDPRNYLYLTANWHLRGQLTDWWRSIGDLEVSDLRGKYVQDSAGQTKSIGVHLEEPVKLLMTADGWRFEGGREPYLTGRDLQLRIGLDRSHPPERLGLKAESVIDLAILKDITQAVETAEGKVHVVAQLPGSVDAPNPHVEISELKPSQFIAASDKPVSIGLADIRPALRNVHLHLLYDTGRFIIDKFVADKGSGSVTASGIYFPAGDAAQDSRIDVSFAEATVIYPVAVLKSFETQVSGNVVFSGRQAPYRLAGDIVINRARSTREMDLRDEIINALRQKSFSAAVVAEKPTIIFDLNITADQSINIHNRNLQMLLSSDLHLRGTDISPIVSGQVEVDKGRFIYKRDFKITRGVLTFDDPVRPDPALDVLAVSDVDNYRVYVSVTGRASNPSVEFSVDPPNRESGSPISEIEILVLLSRGKLPEDSHTLGLETSGALASETANLFLGQFEEPVEKLLGVSGQNVVRNVYIDSHPSPDDGRPVPRLNLPIDLGDNFDLIVRRDVSASQSEVSLEYNLNENINLSGVKDFGSTNDASTTTSSTQTLSTPQTQTPVEGDAKVNLKFRFSFE